MNAAMRMTALFQQAICAMVTCGISTSGKFVSDGDLACVTTGHAWQASQATSMHIRAHTGDVAIYVVRTATCWKDLPTVTIPTVMAAFACTDHKAWFACLLGAHTAHMAPIEHLRPMRRCKRLRDTYAIGRRLVQQRINQRWK